MSTCFVVLEPVNHVWKVIEHAAARGHCVVVVHTEPLHAEGAYRAGLAAVDVRMRITSWDDEDAAMRAIRRAVESRTIVGTYAAHEALLPLDARLRESVGLPTHGPGALARLLDKRRVRRQLREAGLSALADHAPRELLAAHRWPPDCRAAYLKPISGAGSLHVSRCDNLADLRGGVERWDRALADLRGIQKQHLTRGGDLFLEEAAEGELMSLEGWVFDGCYRALGLTSRTLLTRDPTVEMGATFPYDHPLRARIEERIGAMHAALGLRHGATHAELIVTPQGAIELVELNIRFAGSDLLLLIDLAGGRPVGELLVDLACGRHPGEHVVPSQGYASVQQLLAPQGTRVLHGVTLEPRLVVEQRLLKPPGSRLDATDTQQDHVAAWIVRGASYDEVIARARIVRQGALLNGLRLGDDPNNTVLLR